MSDLLLGLMIVLEVGMGWYLLARFARDAQQHRTALLQSQAHIAALVAEVLRRVPPR